MHRRDFLKGSSAAAIAVGTATAAAAQSAKAADDAKALAAPAILPERRTMRMVSLWPDAVTGPGDHVRRFAKRIEAATDGRLLIEIADEPATGSQAFKAVMTGDADLYVGHEHAHRELHPAFSYFAGLPCRTGMDIDRFNAWLMAAGGQELWDELSGEFNMKGLVIGHSGSAHGLFTRQPIHSRADFKGKRIAVDGLAADVLDAVDAKPIENMTNPVDAMITDAALDGIECNGLPSTLSRERSVHFQRTAPHRMLPGLNDAGYALTLGLRRSLWDGFANSERITLSAIACEALATSRADAIAQIRNVALLEQLAFGTVHHLQPLQWRIVSTELTRIAETLVADLSGHDDHAHRINASYMAFKYPRNAAPSS